MAIIMHREPLIFEDGIDSSTCQTVPRTPDGILIRTVSSVLKPKPETISDANVFRPPTDCQHYYRPVVYKPTIRDILRARKNDDQPRLRFQKALSNLIPFNFLLLEAGIVNFYPVQADELLSVAHVPALRRRVGKENKQHGRPDHGKPSKD